MTRLGILFSCVLLGTFSVEAQTPLTLEDVLGSVESNYPPLLATFAERDIASGELLRAEGRFDLQLGAQADTNRLGFYETERLALGFEQPFATGGTSVYGGWRAAGGNFPGYDGSNDTRSGGEWSGGVKIPLMRNREIDDRRAGLQKARLGQDLADLTVDQQRLLIRQFAARRYWDWVAAGQRYQVAQEILAVAQERDQQLRETADLGQIPAIEVTENRRQILQRQSQLAEAERAIQQAAYQLSLFYRDSAGNPLLPLDSQLPDSLPPTMELPEDRLEEDLDFALRNRPEILQYEPLREQAGLDLRLAENEYRPGLDLGLGFTAEAGSGTVLRGPQQFKATLSFQLPFQRRQATGRIVVTEAKLGQIDRRQQYARDQVLTEVRDAASALRIAHARALLATQEVQVALDLADAERVRFDLGDSTLFTVNLREQAAVDAELREIGSINDYLRALTIYEQVTARLLRGP